MLFKLKCAVCGSDFPALRSSIRYCGSRCYMASVARKRETYSATRRHAYSVLNNAVRKGEVLRRPCEVCGREDAHHDDYRKPLEVRWLCKPHHRDHHIKHGTAPG